MSADTADTFRPTDFALVLAACVSLGRMALMPQFDHLDQAIASAERASSAAFALDPGLARDAGLELEQQLKLLTAVRRLGDDLEELRP